jgi:hypothetical protein
VWGGKEGVSGDSRASRPSCCPDEEIPACRGCPSRNATDRTKAPRPQLGGANHGWLRQLGVGSRRGADQSRDQHSEAAPRRDDDDEHECLGGVSANRRMEPSVWRSGYPPTAPPSLRRGHRRGVAMAAQHSTALVRGGGRAWISAHGDEVAMVPARRRGHGPNNRRTQVAMPRFYTQN